MIVPNTMNHLCPRLFVFLFYCFSFQKKKKCLESISRRVHNSCQAGVTLRKRSKINQADSSSKENENSSP